ncbi:hypothetical protein DBR11_25220 [Pedobacter sp. HMWF019]|nr:hypothetical protein DBR11_25220 [Pedobacter sp. HMWF019]
MKKLVFLFALFTLSFHAFAINPSKQYQVRPEQLGLKYQTKKIKVSATVELNSWLFLQNNQNILI